MVCKITKVQECRRVKNTNIYKYKYYVTLNGKNYISLFWDGLENPIVYDEDDDEEVGKHNWYVMQVGYASSRGKYMHKLVHKCDNDMTVDHINEVKLDNRKCNLRTASQSEQNSNRAIRSDKLPPPQELIDAGITELPKHIRWDKSEEKFIIEKHPTLLNEVSQGIRKKPFMSGTKSKKLTILQKYSDIKARLEELNGQNPSNDERIEFQALKDVLNSEYELIKEAIYLYNDLPYTKPVHEDEPNIDIERNTLPNRKTKSNLPDGCGVTLDMLPKYCYYRPLSDKRGDFFVIDRHPRLEKKTWSTTSSSKFTTKQKFEMMMNKYCEIDEIGEM